MTVREATTDAEIRACWPVMRQLRPRYDEDGFVEQVRSQLNDGYRLAMVVDDLVTDSSRRSTGCGRRLLEWIRLEAATAKCDELHLDSGVQRFDAHRFYLRQGMRISSHHFDEKLGADPEGGS